VIEDEHDSRLGTRDLSNQSVKTRVVGNERTDVRNGADTRRDSHDRFTVELVAATRDERVAIDIDRGLGHRRKIQPEYFPNSFLQRR
jgi:hypothetical protein